MQEEIIDSNNPKTEPTPLKEALSWWEKKRIWFNVAVGITGVIVVINNIHLFQYGEIIGLVFYGLLLNLFYSIGFLLEAFNQHYLKGNFHFDQMRIGLFIVGTLASCGITYPYASIYFSWSIN